MSRKRISCNGHFVSHWTIFLLVIQNVKPSSSTKKLAKVNMLSIFSRLYKARKVKKILLEIDNDYMSKYLIRLTRSV